MLTAQENPSILEVWFYSSKWPHFHRAFSFFLGGGGIFFCCWCRIIEFVLFLGLLWNILSFATLVTITRKTLFHKLLMMLTIWDTLFIINGGLFMLQQSLAFQSRIFNTLFPKVIFPMAGMSMTGTYKNFSL